MEKKTITNLLEFLGDLRRSAEQYTREENIINNLDGKKKEQLINTVKIEDKNKQTLIIYSLNQEIGLNKETLEDAEKLLLTYLNGNKPSVKRVFNIVDVVDFFNKVEELL